MGFFFHIVFSYRFNWDCEGETRSVMSDSSWLHGLHSPWNSPGQNTGVGSLPFSRGSSQSRHRIQVSCIAGRFFTSWATREQVLIGIMLNLWIKSGRTGTLKILFVPMHEYGIFLHLFRPLLISLIDFSLIL